jgi:putative NADH-flavin reductase
MKKCNNTYPPREQVCQSLTNDEGESFIFMEDYAFALLDEIEKPQTTLNALLFVRI